MFCAPVAKQEQFIAYALDGLCCTNVKKVKKLRFDSQVQPENRMKPKNCKRVFHFFHIHKMNKNQIPSFILCSFYFFFLTDIDECKTYLNKCHVNATCNNTYGSHVCTCKPGYTGDGRNCTGTINNLRSFHIRFDYYSNFCLLLLFSLFVCLFACFNTVESQDLIFVT